MQLTLKQYFHKGLEVGKAGHTEDVKCHYDIVLKAQPEHAQADNNMDLLAFNRGD